MNLIETNPNWFMMRKITALGLVGPACLTLPALLRRRSNTKKIRFRLMLCINQASRQYDPESVINSRTISCCSKNEQPDSYRFAHFLERLMLKDSPISSEANTWISIQREEAPLIAFTSNDIDILLWVIPSNELSCAIHGKKWQRMASNESWPNRGWFTQRK